MIKKLRSTYFKLFVYAVSFRRNFIPILSIYFLSLDNTFAYQLGIATAAGFLSSFILEVPSGYLSDKIGHRKTLIYTKLSQILSVTLYISAAFVPAGFNYMLFAFGAVFQSIGFAFYSGTFSALFHEILEETGQEKEYGRLKGQLAGRVSLVSMVFIILLPFLTDISILLPMVLWIVIDCIGLIAMLLVPTPKIQDECTRNTRSIKELILETFVNKSLYLLLFIGGITGFFMGEHAYRTIYLEDLGYPIILIGFVMGLSRFFWYIFGNMIHIIEKLFTIKEYLFIEILLFPITYLLIVYFDNPYVVGLLFSLIIGYQQGRKPMLEGYVLNNHVKDRNYKATILSIEGQINSIVSMIIVFGLGFVMSYSMKIGYTIHALIMFAFLAITYFFIFKNKVIHE